MIGADHGNQAYLQSLDDDDLRDIGIEWGNYLRELMELELECDGQGNPTYWSDIYPEGGRPQPLPRYPNRGVRFVKTAWRRHDRKQSEAEAWIGAIDQEMDRRGLEL